MLIRGVVFIALLVAAPWPWYLFAVGGLLPVPLIVLHAFSMPKPILSGVLLLSAALGILVFHLAARALARIGPARRPYAVAVVLGLLFLTSFLPLYGGGENLASPRGKFANLYTAYFGSSLR